MIDGIKDKQMVRWHRNRESGREALWEITPHYDEKLEVEKERDRYCKTHSSRCKSMASDQWATNTSSQLAPAYMWL